MGQHLDLGTVTISSGDPEQYVRGLAADVLGGEDWDLSDVRYVVDGDGGVMICGTVKPLG